ncbi:MAG: competence protein comEA [Myxococcaceae bacterium]|nr:competence protein comEA [Myxococcaceae bacterium]
MKQAMAMVAVAAVLSLGLGNAEAAPRKPGKQVSGMINLNQASAQQLDLLPGVGAKAAARIIEHRKKTPFTRPEELVQVKGFGKKKYDRLKPHLAVAGPTTLRQLPPAEAPTEQGRAAPAAKR